MLVSRWCQIYTDATCHTRTIIYMSHQNDQRFVRGFTVLLHVTWECRQLYYSWHLLLRACGYMFVLMYGCVVNYVYRGSDLSYGKFMSCGYLCVHSLVRAVVNVSLARRTWAAVNAFLVRHTLIPRYRTESNIHAWRLPPILPVSKHKGIKPNEPEPRRYSRNASEFMTVVLEYSSTADETGREELLGFDRRYDSHNRIENGFLHKSQEWIIPSPIGQKILITGMTMFT